MPTYGGVSLAHPTAELREWAAQHLLLDDLHPFRPMPRLNLSTITWPLAAEDLHRPVRLGSLYWPSGASRWAVGTFLATEGQLADIRELAYTINRTTQTQEYVPLEFVMDDGNTYTFADNTTADAKIATDLWMLPPWPLAQNQAATNSEWLLPQTINLDEEPLYLLTLVDDRYFWWHRAAALEVNEGETTWAELIDTIADALGVEIEPDTIATAYVYPPAALATQYEQLPLVLDAVAYSIGHRVLRQLDGTVITQGPLTALASLEEQLEFGYARMAGGLFAFDVE